MSQRGRDRPGAGRTGPSGGLDGRLVNKSDPRQQVGYEGLTFGDPDVARLCHLGPFPLDGAQVFFCVSGQPRDQIAQCSPRD